MTSSDDRAGKKPYQRPTLTVYGDLREITQTVNRDGNVKDISFMGGKSR